MSPTSPAATRSSRLKRPIGLAVASALAVGFTLAAAPAAAAPGDEHLAGLEYVALGDSYASGFGLEPLTGLPAPECAQSTQNYPHQVAGELGLALTDVTCSGARMENLTITPQEVAVATTVLVQNASLSATTDIVSVTIGGIDLGYVDILTSCAAFTAAGPVVAGTTTCAEFYNPGGVDILAAAIDGPITAALEATFAAIASAAPNATVFVVGYPALTPETIPEEGCFRDALGTLVPPYPENSYPFQGVDLAYLHTVEVRFDQAIAAAAQASGATYLSSLADTYDHSGCATEDSYIEGITITSLGLPELAVELAPGAMHPNAAGAAFLATQLQDAIRAEFPAPVDEEPVDEEPVDEPEPAGEVLPATGADPASLLFAGIALLLVGGWAAVARANRVRVTGGSSGY